LGGALGLLGDTFSVTADVQSLRPGGTATFTTAAVREGNPAPAVSWQVSPVLKGATVSGLKDQTTFTYTAPAVQERCGLLEVTATTGTESHVARVTLLPAANVRELCPGSSLSISVVGFEKAGATSADSDPKFFFDFFQSYPLPIERSTWGPKANIYGPPWRWWGDVRIASYPQQVSVPVSQFAGQFAQQLGNLPVNQLVQYGEFRSGLERRIAGFSQYFLPEQGAAYERTSLGAFFYFGGQASLSNPAKIAQVFDIPDPGTPQRAAFDRAFPVSRYPDLGLPATTYIGLTPPDREHAFWQYGAGFRLTTRFFDKDKGVLPAPAMISAAFGQNELITGGRRRGIVGDFEGFYPLPLAAGTIMYLFGRANLRLGGASPLETPLALAPAMSGGKPVQITDPSVAVIAFPSNRDTYAVGVGMDLVQVTKTWMNPTPAK
jgi:hypothetical protein